MKKTVLAVALSLVAGSAIAADVNQNVSERARESMIDLILLAKNSLLVVKWLLVATTHKLQH